VTRNEINNNQSETQISNRVQYLQWCYVITSQNVVWCSWCVK